MRVGLFTESFDPVINGVSTSVKTLAAELAQAGHDATIIAPHYSGFRDEPAEGTGYEVRRLPSWRIAVLNPENPFAFPPVGPMPRAYRDADFEIVHTQQPFGIGLHGQVCARRSNASLVSTFHTLYNEYAHYAPFLPRRVAQAIIANHLKRYYNACAAVVVPSKAAGRILEGVGVEQERLAVIPTGIPEAPAVMQSALQQTRKTYSLPPYAPVLLFVGRIAREKNLDLLIDAFAHLSARHPVSDPASHPILLLVGSGPYLGACQDRVRRAGIDAYVRFAGFLPRQQLAPIYATATLFVFPSATETQGVVLSEAQSHGVPCVLVNGGGAPEFVRADVDALVVPAEVEAFSEAVVRLLNDVPLRRAYASAALASPLRTTPSGMARLMIDLYREVRTTRLTLSLKADSG